MVKQTTSTFLDGGRSVASPFFHTLGTFIVVGGRAIKLRKGVDLLNDGLSKLFCTLDNLIFQAMFSQLRKAGIWRPRPLPSVYSMIYFHTSSAQGSGGRVEAVSQQPQRTECW